MRSPEERWPSCLLAAQFEPVNRKSGSTCLCWEVTRPFLAGSLGSSASHPLPGIIRVLQF